jgi:hypothetical protein
MAKDSVSVEARHKAQEIVLESMQALVRHVKKHPVQTRPLSCQMNPSVKPTREQMNIVEGYWQFIDEFNEREVAYCERRVRDYEDVIARGLRAS